MDGISIYAYLGIPPQVSVIIFTLALILTIAPYAPERNFGIFNVPAFSALALCRLRVIGPIFFLLSVVSFIPLWPTSAVPQPQQTRWGPSDGRPAGIYLDDARKTVIDWRQLKREIEKGILPQVYQVPSGSSVALRDFQGKKDWIVVIQNPSGIDIASVWFGVDPMNHWVYDGLVRVGRLDAQEPQLKPVVWQIFQRHSDGSYRRKR
jgi:hypothetical protein